MPRTSTQKGYDESWADITWAGSVPEVSPGWTQQHRDDIRLIDIREADELVGKLGQIPEVEHIPMGELDEEAADWSRDQKIVLLCRSGGRSGRATNRLRKLGFTRIASMAGGMIRWNEEGLPSTA
jgi:rhodanese-related sulfurtransferase